MTRQTRSEIAPKRYRLLTTTLVVGLIGIWIGTQHMGSLPLVGAGAIVSAASAGTLYKNRSQPLTEFTEGRYVDEEVHNITESARGRDIIPPARSLVKATDNFDEVEEVTVRPLPSSASQVVEMKLTGGRVSPSLAEEVDESIGKARMRDPTSDDFYTLFVRFGG